MCSVGRVNRFSKIGCRKGTSKEKKKLKMTLSFCSEQPEEQNGGRNARERSKLGSENKNVNFILHIHFEMTIRHPKILCHQMEKSAGMSGWGGIRKEEIL